MSDDELEPAPAGERLYTLGEARAELARRQCATWGHDWQIVSREFEPRELVCDRCMERRVVSRRPAP